METVHTENRRTWIDFAKFLGILFVLLSHMELRIPLISDYAYLFYVPVFFVLAGFTYNRHEESFLSFVNRKARRLLAPYFLYSLFLYLFFFLKDYVLKGAVTREALQPLLGILYARNCLYPMDSANNTFFLTILNSPMWFLPALFLSFVIFEICIRISGDSWRRMLVNNVLIMGLGIFIMYISPVLLPWSLDTVFLFEVFMSAGYVMKNSMKAMSEADANRTNEHDTDPDTTKQDHRKQDHRKQDNRKQNGRHIITLVIMIMLTCILGTLNGPMNVSVGNLGESIAIGVVVGILSSESIILLCYMIRKHIPTGAARIGRSSMTIMCLHMFLFMFVKTGINILNPEILIGNGILTVFIKAMAVSLTLALITIFDIYRKHITDELMLNRKGAHHDK